MVSVVIDQKWYLKYFYFLRLDICQSHTKSKNIQKITP